MKLYEHEAIRLFEKHGIPTIPGKVFHAGEKPVSESFPVVVKAQVLAGGRGKAGGVKFAESRGELEEKAQEIFSLTIKGYPVEKILVRPAVEIHQEYYLGFTIDRSEKAIALIFSTEGGVDIEETAKKSPKKIYRKNIEGEIGGKAMREMLDMDSRLDEQQFTHIVSRLLETFREEDADLAEINPLGLTPRGLLALDAKITIDENALFRHPELKAAGRIRTEKEVLEEKAREKDLAYVCIEGDIGVIGCGAGLVMATLDLISDAGGKPSCFLDLGGGASTEKTRAGLDIVLENKDVKAVLINAFCGITRCDELAQAITEYETKVPLYIRMTGTLEEEGKKILRENGFNVYDNMQDAITAAVEAAK